MKKMSLLLIMAFGLVFIVGAHPPHGEKGKQCNKSFSYKSLSPEQRAEKLVEKLNKNLSLTDAQANQIKLIKTESFNEVEKIRAPFQSTLDKMHEEMKKVKESLPETDSTEIGKIDRTAFKDVKEKYKDDLQPMHEALKKQHQSDKEKINALLTEEQQAIFQSTQNGTFHGQRKPCKQH